MRPAVLLVIAVALGAGEPSDADLTVHAAPRPLAADAVVHDWRSFGGPRHDMTSTETRLSVTWPAAGPVKVWERRKGTGYSAPAIAVRATVTKRAADEGVGHDRRLVMVHRRGDDNVMECVHPETGARLWSARFPTAYRDRYGYNDGPRASPVIAGDHIFWHSQEGMLRCLALADGAVRWSCDTTTRFKVPQDFFGTASTPLVHGDLLIVQIGAPGGPGVVAFDLATGAERWRADDQWGPSYASPVPAVIHGQPRVLVFAGGESRPPTGGLLVIDPADGRVVTRFPWRSRSYESVNASCPLPIGDRVFVSASYATGGALLDLLPDGGHREVWRSEEAGTHFMTAVQVDGHLYATTGRNEPDAELVCIELATGKIRWREAPRWRETVAGREMTLGLFRAQLLRVDGRFLVLGEAGHLVWYDLSPQGAKELSRAWLFPAQETWTPPVLAHGLLYVMQNHAGMDASPTRLICYDLRGP